MARFKGLQHKASFYRTDLWKVGVQLSTIGDFIVQDKVVNSAIMTSMRLLINGTIFEARQCKNGSYILKA